MKDFSSAVNNAMQAMIDSGKVEEIIKVKLEKTVESAIDDALRSYSDFGKSLTKHIESSLKVDVDAEAVINTFSVSVQQSMPPMDKEMAWILGSPNFTLAGIARRLRELGHFIKERSEDEQAAVIYWMLNLYLQHGTAWRDEGEKVLARKEAQTEPA